MRALLNGGILCPKTKPVMFIITHLITQHLWDVFIKV
jgi:hypothetical protein